MKTKTRNRSRPGVLVSFAVAAALTALGLWRWFNAGFTLFDTESSVAGNLGFFLLINLNIVIVMILGFLVVKNVVKLFLDRRRNILGSKLRARLVAAFVGLSLIPTVLLFIVAKGILERVLQGWFSPQVAASVDGSLDIAKLHYEQAESQLFRQVDFLSTNFSRVLPYFLETPLQSDRTGDPALRSAQSVPSSGAKFGRALRPKLTAVPTPEQQSAERSEFALAMQQYLDEKRREYGLYALAVLDTQNRVVAEVTDASRGQLFVPVPGPNLGAVAKAHLGKIIVQPEQSLHAEFLRAYAPLSFSLVQAVVDPATEQRIYNQFAGAGLAAAGAKESRAGPTLGPTLVEASRYTLVATQWVPPALSQALATVIDAHEDYHELRTYHRPLASSYFLTLVIVTLLVIFAAVWVGFYLARGLSIPIGLLAEGTQQVAHGNLDYRIPELGDDELSVLVKSFNTMTQDLKSTTHELVSRRRYMETVMSQVGVGVVSLDTNGQVTTCNSIALTILGLPTAALFDTQSTSSVFPPTINTAVDQMRAALASSSEKLVAQPVVLGPEEGSKHVQLTLTRLVGESGTDLGSVLLLDDISDLVGAQRMAAWRDVARRIAHEIKNPLTPIQLNAQRLQRKFGTSHSHHLLPVQILRESDRSMIGEATEMIIKQVEILRNLVNEFSRFARMPRAQLSPSDLGAVVQQAVTFFREAHPAIEFQVQVDPQTPVFQFDKEQMNRVLVNLLTNSVSAIESLSAGPQSEQKAERGLVAVRLEYNAAIDLVTLEVADNGIGISADDKPKLFEPYYSTKRSGTGLGLAIVNSIVADHSGFIRVRDNAPRGARFSIELPVDRAPLRKHA